MLRPSSGLAQVEHPEFQPCKYCCLHTSLHFSSKPWAPTVQCFCGYAAFCSPWVSGVWWVAEWGTPGCSQSWGLGMMLLGIALWDLIEAFPAPSYKRDADPALSESSRTFWKALLAGTSTQHWCLGDPQRQCHSGRTSQVPDAPCCLDRPCTSPSPIPCRVLQDGQILLVYSLSSSHDGHIDPMIYGKCLPSPCIVSLGLHFLSPSLSPQACGSETGDT